MEIEEQAREQGWVPKEDWKGDPEKWSEAKVFIDKGEKIAGILKSRVDRQSVEIEELKASNRQFGEFAKKSQDKLRQENATLLTQLEEQIAKAVTDGDGQEYTRASREYNRVDEEMKNVGSNGKLSNPEADAWLVDNDWYNTNRKMQIYADGVADHIIREGFTGSAYWAELSRRVKADNPEEFGNPNQDKPNTVEAGRDIAPKDKTAHSYDNLPADAKSACDRYVKDGLTSQDDYLKNYEW